MVAVPWALKAVLRRALVRAQVSPAGLAFLRAWQQALRVPPIAQVPTPFAAPTSVRVGGSLRGGGRAPWAHMAR